MSGALMAIGASFFFSLSHVTVKRGVSSLGVQVGTAFMLSAGVVTVGILTVLLADWQHIAQANALGLLYFAVAGIIHFVGGWGFQNASANIIGASRMSATIGATPMFAAIFAVLFLNESLSLMQALGILLIMVSIYLITES